MRAGIRWNGSFRAIAGLCAATLLLGSCSAPKLHDDGEGPLRSFGGELGRAAAIYDGVTRTFGDVTLCADRPGEFRLQSIEPETLEGDLRVDHLMVKEARWQTMEEDQAGVWSEETGTHSLPGTLDIDRYHEPEDFLVETGCDEEVWFVEIAGQISPTSDRGGLLRHLLVHYTHDGNPMTLRIQYVFYGCGSDEMPKESMCDEAR